MVVVVMVLCGFLAALLIGDSAIRFARKKSPVLRFIIDATFNLLTGVSVYE